MEKQRDKRDKIIDIVMVVLLFCYPLRHILHGVDLWDTGYNYANFTYLDNMDSMWYYSTYLANIVGNLFTRLPLGDTYVGMNLYTGLVLSALAVVGFLFCIRVLKISRGIAFLGVFLAVCLSWCPTALLYNYLTYLLLLGAVILLYLALEKESRFSGLYFVLAGVLLGLNIFVRFSNLAQAAMILAVWAMAIIRREKFGKVVKQTFICLGGYLLGIIVGVCALCLRGSISEYVNGITRLMSMPSEAEGYSVQSMVYGQMYQYLGNLKWLGYLVLFMLVGIVLYMLLWRKFEKFATLFYMLGLVLLVPLLNKLGMCIDDYGSLYSVYQWAVLFLVLTHLLGLVIIFGKGFSEREKLICGLNMLVILLTPLGSNNYLFSAMNNLYIAAPVTIWMLWRFVRWLPKYIVARKLVLPCKPIKIMLIFIVFVLMGRSMLVSIEYVFAEATGGYGHNTTIDNNDVLRWVKTDKAKAQSLEEISGFVSENGLKGKEVLLYGNVPALSFYLEMPFVLSPWPDLLSYNQIVMTEALAELREDMDEKGRECPVIILSAGTDYLAGGNRKLEQLRDMIENYEYEIAFENDRFVLLMANKQ